MIDLQKIRISELLTRDTARKAILALGLLGMALILLSQFLPARRAQQQPDSQTAQFTSAEYAADLENRLSDLIRNMQGVGSASVMVTLESGAETIYAQQEKRNTDQTSEGGAAEAAKTFKKENVEQSYILIENNGNKQALVKTQLQPRVQGVVVACQGADNPLVEQSVIHVVTTALNIPTTRVCVVKIAE